MPRIPNIFLIGPMGVGKSTIGKRLASKAGLRFIDSDSEIERRTGVEIDRIFDIEGEPGFRKREREMLDELTAMQEIVLATGGGAVLDPDTRERLKARGRVVYLTASAEVLARRTEHDKKRPLLRDSDRPARLRELLSERSVYYLELADCVVDTTNCSIRQAVDRICLELKLECSS